jgi:hypothetical protein
MGQAHSGNEDMKFIQTLSAGGAAPALTAKSLEPASPAVKAATKENNQHDDNDEKCRRVHAVLL